MSEAYRSFPYRKLRRQLFGRIHSRPAAYLPILALPTCLRINLMIRGGLSSCSKSDRLPETPFSDRFNSWNSVLSSPLSENNRKIDVFSSASGGNTSSAVKLIPPSPLSIVRSASADTGLSIEYSTSTIRAANPEKRLVYCINLIRSKKALIKVEIAEGRCAVES
jgi:hypothetical protein